VKKRYVVSPHDVMTDLMGLRKRDLEVAQVMSYVEKGNTWPHTLRPSMHPLPC